MARIEWKIPASVFRAPVKKFIQEFSAHIDGKRPFPVARFFQLFPLNTENHEIEEEIKDRGLLSFKDGTTFNEGEIVQASFKDAKIGGVSVYFPKRIEASVSRSPQSISFAGFSSVVVRFDDLPPEFSLGSRFSIKKISFSEASVEYLLGETDTPTNELLIIADLMLSVRENAGSRRESNVEFNAETAQSQSLSHHVLFGMALATDGPCCTGEKGETWVIRRATMSGICYVQKKQASPLGVTVTLAGEYESCADARAAKEDLIKKGDCAPE